MNSEVKALWIKNLRSGEFKQGKAVLYNPEGNSYCCLGVLAKQCGFSLTNPLSVRLMLDQKEADSIGLKIKRESPSLENPDISVKNTAWDLADMNDGNHTFAEIADHIEKYL
tara:strand:- start:200 stop:535 length:336 start_codon:yes stop_codon:yes gene_type:complete